MPKTNYKRDYFAEAHQILKNLGYKNYIQKLLPGGKFKGNEYIVKNPRRADNNAGSFSINVTNGKWSDFATGDKGKDLISLIAYIKGISKKEACFYIGVPRPVKSNTNDIAKTDLNAPTEAEEEEEIECTEEEIQEHIASLNKDLSYENLNIVKQKVIKDNSSITSPDITENDVAYHNKKFSCLPSAYYKYTDKLGTTAFYIVRWDFTKDDKEQKAPLPYVFDTEKGKWMSRGYKAPSPLYNLVELTSRPDVPVMVVEGEKTAEAAKGLFPAYVVTTSSGGCQGTKKTDWSVLQGRDVIISYDNDEAGVNYRESIIKIFKKGGYLKSLKLLMPQTLGSYVIENSSWVERQEDVPKGYDLADSFADGWTAELINKAMNEFKTFFNPYGTTIIIKDENVYEGEEVLELKNHKFKLGKKMLYLEHFIPKQNVDENGEVDLFLDNSFNNTLQQIWIPICGYLKATHYIRDIDSGNWGILLKMIDIDGKTKDIIIQKEELATDKTAIELLLRNGLEVLQLKKINPKLLTCDLLNDYINSSNPIARAIGVDTVGWQGDNKVYILPFVNEPRNCYSVKQAGKKTPEYILQQKSATPRILKKKGTLEEWKRTIGGVCRGNHLHTFAILASLTAPALKLLNEEGGFFHYIGSTSIGKSTILQVAKSVWGFKDLGSFRATDNSLESVCKNSNDGAMFLDELGEANADDLFKIIYMMANGVTKGRADRNGNAKEISHFKVIVQTTGEIGVEDKLREKKIQAKGGQLIRMAEINADRSKGLNTFDVLNINPDTNKPFISGKEQADFLKTYADENCGIVIDEFMKKVVADIEDYKAALKKTKASWLEDNFTGDEGVEVTRMAKRFSTIFATGVIAVELAIIPHSIEEIEACIDEIFASWLERYGGDCSFEYRKIKEDLRKLCVEQQYSRFLNADPNSEEKITLPHNKAGYWKIKDGVLYEYWIDPAVFERDVLKGRDKKVFYPLLAKDGYIKKEEKDRYSCKRKPAKEERQNFIVVDASKLIGEDSEKGEENK